MMDWTPYFESIRERYAHWWDVYTLTDVEGKIRQQKTAHWFMDLKVQTVERKQEEAGRQEEERGKKGKEEKIERLTVLEGLKKYAANHVLLSGRPGSGKSTALARLLLEESVGAQGLRPEQRNLSIITQVPVLIELRFYQTSIFDLILQFLQRHELIIDRNALENLLTGQATVLPLLLFDGINELPSEEARRDLQRFRESYPKVPMIFTTRDLGIGGDLQIEKKLEMLPLNDSQMREFVRAYLPEKGEQMLRQLGDRLREFGQTPLLLWMLCSVFESNESQIPANLGLVFRQFTEIYDRKLKADVATYQGSREWWRQLLQVLAWKMTQGESKTEIRIAIGQREAEAAITAFVLEKGFPEFYGKKWLKDLLKHHLIQLESNDQIAFRHQLIQEYYAAEALLEKLPDLSEEELRWDYLNYLKWTETIALMLGMEDREEQARRVVKLGLEIDLKLGARLAGEVRVEFQKQTVGLVLGLDVPKRFKIDLLELTKSDDDEVVNELNQALEHSDNGVRCNAVKVLGNIGTEAAISRLLQALEHFDKDVRWNAAKALGEIGAEAAIPRLINALEDYNKYVRGQAAEALGEIGAEAAIPRLINALEDSDQDVRKNAAEALGKIGTEAAIPGLLQALEDSDGFVSWNAAKALGKISSEVAIPGLIKALEDSDSNVRWNAAKALGKISSEVALPWLLQALEDSDSNVRWNAAQALVKIGSEVALPWLLQALEHSDSNVRMYAIKAVDNFSSEAAIPLLLRALQNSDKYVRSYAVEALVKIGSEVALPWLLEALEDSNWLVRRDAAEALGKIGTEAAIPGLLKALEDSNWRVRRDAAKALGKISSEVAISGLIKALEDSNEYVRRIAAQALGDIGAEAATPGLLKALEDSDGDVRWDAARSLGKISSEVAIPGLLQALDDSDGDVRRQAAESLGEIGAEAAITGLLKALEDSDGDVRRDAAKALGKISSEVAIPGLLKALEDSNEYVRRIAAQALGDIGTEAAIPGLLQALEHSDWLVLRDAAKALGEIGSEAAITGLLQALDDSDGDVRRQAAESLGEIGLEATLTALFNAVKNPDFVAANNGDTFYQAHSALSTIQDKLKYYRPPQPIQPSIESSTHPESKYTIKAKTVQIIEKGDGKIQNSP